MAPDERVPDAPGLLSVAGMNHRTAPVAVREQLALEEEKIREILADLAGRGFLHEVMILSTCNRVEVYGVAAVPGEARSQAFSRLGSHRGVAWRELEPLLYTATGDEAALHAFRVAASLDSMGLGEPQILGQVKDAFALAHAAGTPGPGGGGPRRAGTGGPPGAPGAAALLHRHRGAPQRGAGGERPGGRLLLRHRRPARGRRVQPQGAPAGGPARPDPARARGREIRGTPAAARGRPHHRVAAREAGSDPARGAGARARPPARRGRGHAPRHGRAQPGHREQGAPRADGQAQGFVARGPRSPLDGDDLGAVRAARTRARPVRMNVRLGTRGSRLALVQCEQVAAALRAHGARVEVVVIRTSGDRLAQVALADFGGN